MAKIGISMMEKNPNHVENIRIDSFYKINNHHQ